MRVKQGEAKPTGTAGKPVFIYRHLTHFISHLSMSALCPNLALCQHIISICLSPLYKHTHTPPAFYHMVKKQNEYRSLSAARNRDSQILSTWKQQQLLTVKTHLNFKQIMLIGGQYYVPKRGLVFNLAIVWNLGPLEPCTPIGLIG